MDWEEEEPAEVDESVYGSRDEYPDADDEDFEDANGEEEIRVTDERDELLESEARATSGEEIRVIAAVGADDPPPVEDPAEAEHDDEPVSEAGDGDERGTGGRDWLGDVERTDGATLEWPAAEIDEPAPGERERIDTPRVRHLFPVPEDADWEVRELDYDRRKTANGR